MSVGSQTVVEVFADVGCPFAHVGLLRFVEERAERGRGDVLLSVHSWPLEVVNGEAMEGSFIAEEAAEIRDQIGRWFDGFDGTNFPPSSLAPMALAAKATEQDPAAGESVNLELRRLLFEQNADVSRPEVLAEVAERWSVDWDPDDVEGHRQMALASHEEGRRRGVTGSPHYFISSGDWFCPALEVGRDDSGELNVEFDPATFDGFLDACFA